MNIPNRNPTAQFGARVLIVEDEPAHAEAIQRSLGAANWTNIEVVETLRDFRIRSVATPPAIALVDLNLPDGRATELLSQPAEEGAFPIIIMTSHGDEKTVMEVMKNGAFDYLVKAQEVFLDLPRTLARSLRQWELQSERVTLMNEAKAIYDLSIDMICIVDLSGNFRRLNPSFQRTLGYTPEELCSQSYIQFVHPDDRAATLAEIGLLAKGNKTLSFSNRHQTKAGGYRWLEWNASLGPQGDLFYAVARDVTERKLAEEKIHHLAFYDALTLLPNRRLLTDRLRHAMAVSNRTMEHAAVLFIDLDNFKMLNDTRGHNIGDMLLIEFAHRLQLCVREVDMIARLGGDEFVVLLEGLSQNREHAAEQTLLVGENIRDAAAQPYKIQGMEYFCSASIGISLFSGESNNLDELLKHADAAMYQAKGAGRNALRFYDPQMQSELEGRARLEADLRYALTGDQFKLYYQVQMDARSEVIGAEALLRWQHPLLGLVSPLQFIPIAEVTGLIVPIGAWVLQTACAQIKQWQENPHTSHFQLAVNVSARQFAQTSFVSQVLDIIKMNGIEAKYLKLELTESLLLENINSSITKMHALREAGVSIAMDDFGTGHSSLNYLRRLPLDQIKIDQSFVHEIAVDKDAAAIVKTIIMMARNLGMEVIAEGVETKPQREFLEQNGCYLYQGYFFGKPMPIEDFQLALLAT